MYAITLSFIFVVNVDKSFPMKTIFPYFELLKYLSFSHILPTLFSPSK